MSISEYLSASESSILSPILSEFKHDVIVYKYPLNPVVEAAKKIWERQDKIVVFHVDGSSIPVVSNIVTRWRLLRILNARSDVEAYKKLVHALNNPRKIGEGSLKNHPFNKVKSLTSIPILKFYPKDAGRYITSAIVIGRDPELGYLNASIHRLLVIDESTMVIRIVPRHLHTMLMKYKRMGKKMPISIAITVHPIVLLASASSPPYGVFELEVANTLLNGILEVDYSLGDEVPILLNADIVMKAYIDPQLYVDEGPFVDILGIYDIVRKQPIVKVEEIYVREGGFYHTILPGGIEHKVLMGFPREAVIWDSVSRVVSEVKSVRLTPGSGSWLHAVISIKKRSEGEGKNAILAAFAAHPSLKHVIVVDDDIDIDNPDEIEWALATRFRADRDLIIINYVKGSTLDPTSENGLTSKMGIDATKPLDKDPTYFEKAKFD